MAGRKPPLDAAALRARLERLDAAGRVRFLKLLDQDETRAVAERWGVWGHDGQHAPPGDWRTWVIMAGRSFGKFRAGAECEGSRLYDSGRQDRAGRRLAGRSAAYHGREASELLAIAGSEAEKFYTTKRLLRFANGAEPRSSPAPRPSSCAARGGDGISPDQADAMVWAFIELMPGERRREPREGVLS